METTETWLSHPKQLLKSSYPKHLLFTQELRHPSPYLCIPRRDTTIYFVRNYNEKHIDTLLSLYRNSKKEENIHLAKITQRLSETRRDILLHISVEEIHNPYIQSKKKKEKLPASTQNNPRSNSFDQPQKRLNKFLGDYSCNWAALARNRNARKINKWTRATSGTSTTRWIKRWLPD